MQPDTLALPPSSFDGLVGTLRAVAEPTRLRLVVLLSRAELTVTEISQVIGQSQPRTSRHLRLLVDAGILERSPEGAFVFYRLAEGSAERRARSRRSPRSRPRPTRRLPPTWPRSNACAARARRRLRRTSPPTPTELGGAPRRCMWGRPRSSAAMLELLVGEGPIGRLLDIGTGTGRILELLAPHSERSVGLDVDHDMLLLARAALGEAQLSQASVRQGDLHRPPFEAASFDVAVMHHVLHLLDDPGAAVADAARLLRPGGRLLVADFAPHELELSARAPRSPPPRDR